MYRFLRRTFRIVYIFVICIQMYTSMCISQNVASNMFPHYITKIIFNEFQFLQTCRLCVSHRRHNFYQCGDAKAFKDQSSCQEQLYTLFEVPRDCLENSHVFKCHVVLSFFFIIDYFYVQIKTESYITQNPYTLP